MMYDLEMFNLYKLIEHNAEVNSTDTSRINVNKMDINRAVSKRTDFNKK